MDRIAFRLLQPACFFFCTLLSASCISRTKFPYGLHSPPPPPAATLDFHIRLTLLFIYLIQNHHFHCVRFGCGAYPVHCAVVTGDSFSGIKWPGWEAEPSSFHLVPRLRFNGAVPPFCHVLSLCAQEKVYLSRVCFCRLNRTKLGGCVLTKSSPVFINFIYIFMNLLRRFRIL